MKPKYTCIPAKKENIEFVIDKFFQKQISSDSNRGNVNGRPKTNGPMNEDKVLRDLTNKMGLEVRKEQKSGGGPTRWRVSRSME